MKMILHYAWDTVIDLLYLLWFLIQIIALAMLSVMAWLWFWFCYIFVED